MCSQERSHLGLAFAHGRKGQRDKTIGAYRRVLAVLPNDPRAQNNLAWAPAGERGFQDEALKLAQQAVSVSPTNGQFLDTLGWVFLQQGKLAEAEQQFRLASDLLPNEAMI